MSNNIAKIRALLDDFVSACAQAKVNIEAVAFGDKTGLKYVNKIVNRPYRDIYSHTKSFVSLMTGIAIAEGRISLDDHVVNFLDELTEAQKREYYAIQVKHCLRMSSGFGESLLMSPEREKGVGFPDYIKFIFSHPLKYKPGEHFDYSNGDTYIVARILEKVYGNDLHRVIYERILAPMGIRWTVCTHDPLGHMFGASGMHLSIEEQNKFGILCLNRGNWKGDQLVPEDWFNEITEAKQDTEGKGWGNYSYQFWMTPGHGYRADGAFGQITYILPENGVTISVQRPEEPGAEKAAEFMVRYVLSKIDGND